MKVKSRILVPVICAVLTFVSLSAAEELYVVGDESIDAASLASLEGINVYAYLENGFLVGADSDGGELLLQEGLLRVSLGERDYGSRYFVFQIRNEDIGKLSSGIELIHIEGNEAIARVDKGTRLDPASLGVMHLLTDISFHPMPSAVERKPASPPRRLLPDPQVEIIVGQVSETTYTAYIQRLQDFVTRYAYTDSCRAAEQWAADIFSGMGLESELWPFSYDGNTWYNIIGRKVGTVYPDSIYMVIGHIDDTSENPYYDAPGAEDNGSGSACVLEAARVLSQYDFDCTIEFVLVSGEELGLIGSEAYAEYCADAGRNIAGVLNFDMISYAGSYGWDTNIYADQNFQAEVDLADLLAQLTDEYSNAYPVRVDTDGPTYGSDHYYFSLYGFPAPFSIDAQMWGAPDWYPWYHTTDDVITHLDLDFGTEVVKGGVAALATLADPSVPPLLVFDYPDGLPELIDPNGGTTFRVEVTPGTADPQPGTGTLYYSTGGAFTSIPMDVVSPNVYDAVFPSLECGVVVSFYVSALTVDDSLFTDPPTAPERTYSAFSAYGVAVVYEDDFSTNQGWSGLGGNGEWTIGVATGGNGDDSYGGPDPSQDHSPSGDNKLLGNDLTFSDGDYENNLNTTYWVTSPVIDCSDNLGVTLSFFRWLGVEQDVYDNAYLQVYNGSAWVTVFENGPSTIDESSWREMTYDVSAMADGNPDFRIRFGIGSTDGAWQYCGWNVDDIAVSGYSCVPPGLSTGLVPDEDPTIVPQGGAFGMTASVTNSGPDATTTDVWLGAYRNTHFFLQRLYENVPMAAGQTRQAHFLQAVPDFAPPGDYSYVEFCGDYGTWAVVDSSFFTVTVTGATSAEGGIREEDVRDGPFTVLEGSEDFLKQD